MSHLYEVTIYSGTGKIVSAGSSKEAKAKVCKDLAITWFAMSSIKAHRVNVDHPDVNYRPLYEEEALQQYIGKDVVIYDEHHGTATRIKKSTVAAIQYYLDEYSTIIVLD